MLAYGLRAKFPNVVVGALASSAPILSFQHVDGYDEFAFNRIIEQDYRDAGGEACVDSVRAGYEQIESLASQGASGLARIGAEMALCEPMRADEVDVLNNFVSNAFSYCAMTDYSDAADFLQPMPAWPVNATCAAMASPLATSPLDALRRGISVYYNTSGTLPCFNITAPISPGLGTLPWSVQACTEMLFPISSDGGFFPKQLFSMNATLGQCRRFGGLVGRPDWFALAFQSDAIGRAQQTPGATVNFVSNVLLPNGAYDPWHSGGVLRSLSPSVHGMLIAEAAHHADLRTPTPQDPQPLRDARQFETKTIDQWINDNQ
jgi:lysosomal Pro-X carboxypeptidase